MDRVRFGEPVSGRGNCLPLGDFQTLLSQSLHILHQGSLALHARQHESDMITVNMRPKYNTTTLFTVVFKVLSRDATKLVLFWVLMAHNSRPAIVVALTLSSMCPVCKATANRLLTK
jgi:hypothetical protein